MARPPTMGGKTTKKQLRASDETAQAKKSRTAAATAARLRKAQARATKPVAAARAVIAARAAKAATKIRGSKSLRGTWCHRGWCTSSARSSAW